MLRLMMIAAAIAAMVGTSFEKDWACWENFVEAPRYACQYIPPNGEGLNILVYSHDGGDFHIIRGYSVSFK